MTFDEVEKLLFETGFTETRVLPTGPGVDPCVDRRPACRKNSEFKGKHPREPELYGNLTAF